MRTADNTTYAVQDTFDSRYLNVLKLATVLDCDIAIAEIKNCLDGIDADIKGQYGDEDWERSARAAKRDYEHKGRMGVLKRAGLLEVNGKKADESRARADQKSFYWAAKELLERDVFDKIDAKANAITSPENAGAEWKPHEK